MAKRIERKMSSFGGDSSAAETVVNIEELLTQILVSLPARSVARFKCVSKHWLSHISKPDFFRHYTLQNSNISAFFSERTEELSFKSIPVGNHEIPSGWNPFKTLNNSVHYGSRLRIIQSCNGLFLCVFESWREGKHRHVYVVNPTTNRFLALSSPRAMKNVGMGLFMFVRYGLAFDPSKSPYYKVVCVSNRKHNHWEKHNHNHWEKHHHIQIYSSETRKWKQLDKIPFFPSPSDEHRHYGCGNKMPMHFDHRSKEGAVYCNDAIHWIRNQRKLPEFSVSDESDDDREEFGRDESDVLHYFDIGEESLRLAAATPPVPLFVKNIPSDEDGYPTDFPCIVQRYFGECGGHLCLIEIYGFCNTQFEVMEMERDYSGWFVKYYVDLNPVFAALPDSNPFVVLCLCREKEKDNEVDEDSSTDVLLHMPGKVISYNLKNKTFKTSVELANKELFLALNDPYSFRDEDDNYSYMETLACV